MTGQDLQAVIAMIRATYPNARFDEANIAAYGAHLADLEVPLLRAVVTALCRTSEWPPTVAAIRGRYAEAASTTPTAEAAWGEVSTAMRRCGRTRQPAWTHELIGRVVREMGWFDLCGSTSIAADRKAFRDRYTQLREGEIEQVQTGGTLEAGAVARMLGGRTPKQIGGGQ